MHTRGCTYIHIYILYNMNVYIYVIYTHMVFIYLNPQFLKLAFLKIMHSWSSLVVPWVKDLALLLLWCGFDLWPGNIHLLWVWPKKNDAFLRHFS